MKMVKTVCVIGLFCMIYFVKGARRESISECDQDKKVPYRAIVNDDGTIQLSCRYVDCVNATQEQPQCDQSYHTDSCDQFPEWLHGVRQLGGLRRPIDTKCCKYSRLNDARFLGTTVLQLGQGFLGGIKYAEGQGNASKRDGFDVITNIAKEDRDTYRIWVYRMRCIPPPPKQQQFRNPSQYYDTRVGGNPNVDYQQVQLRDQNGNIQTVPVLYSSGCFSSGTTVHTKHRGSIPIEQLRIGEDVLTVHDKTVSYRPVAFFLHRDPTFTAHYLTLHTDHPSISVTMTPYHITFSGPCPIDPSKRGYPQKFAKEVLPGDCLMFLDEERGRIEKVRVLNISESWRKGIYSPITSNGIIVTNNIVSSCYSFIKNQDLQASVFYFMMKLEEFLHEYLGKPMGWLLGGEEEKVDIPKGLDLILTLLNRVLPVSRLM